MPTDTKANNGMLVPAVCIRRVRLVVNVPSAILSVQITLAVTAHFSYNSAALVAQTCMFVQVPVKLRGRASIFQVVVVFDT